MENEIYSKFIEEKKIQGIQNRRVFLDQKIPPLSTLENFDSVAKYLTEFPFLIDNFIFFYSPDVVNKLKEINISNGTRRWLIDSDKILFEIDNLYINLNKCFDKKKLFALIESHLYISFFNSFLSEIHPPIIKNNQDINFLYHKIKLLFERIDYALLNKIVPKFTFFELMLICWFHHEMGDFINNKEIRKTILKTFSGRSKEAIQVIKYLSHKPDSISQRKFYKDLFPILKLILPDHKLLSKEEFENTMDEKYGGDYEVYKYNKVRKLLAE